MFNPLLGVGGLLHHTINIIQALEDPHGRQAVQVLDLQAHILAARLLCSPSSHCPQGIGNALKLLWLLLLLATHYLHYFCLRTKVLLQVVSDDVSGLVEDLGGHGGNSDQGLGIGFEPALSP